MKKVKKIIIYIICALGLLGAIGFILSLHPKFGKAPSGERLAKMQQTPNFKNGVFYNLSHTPSLAKGHSTFKVFYDFFFTKFPNTVPDKEIPSVKTDLKSLAINQDILVWFGHSSYYFQLNGKRFLVDPVFSGNVSPIPNTANAFKGSDIYTVADIPKIDYLLITHDHYDHLDYETIIALKNKVTKVICPLGVGSHLEHWGFKKEDIIERYWYERIELPDNLKIDLAPTRHFSGRTHKRNNTLWTSYIVQFPDYKLYVGGDSGYDSHFKAIGEQYGPIDFALLENGQYNEAWHYIHMFPQELLQAANDIKAKRVMPIHSGKFKLAHHEWNLPLKEVTRLNDGKINLATPKIGEVVLLKNEEQTFTPWWE